MGILEQSWSRGWFYCHLSRSEGLNNSFYDRLYFLHSLGASNGYSLGFQLVFLLILTPKTQKLSYYEGLLVPSSVSNFLNSFKEPFRPSDSSDPSDLAGP